MSKIKTNLEKFQDFKRMNKVAREKKAVREGYPDASAYMAVLKEQAEGKTTTKKAKIVTALPVVHIVDVLDRSGSMSGSRISSAIKGINSGIESLKKDTTIDYIYTVCQFDNVIHFPLRKEKISKVGKQNFVARGSTSLYDAIGQTIELINSDLEKDAKVLVNIYTDGGENSSTRYSAKTIAKLIKEYSEKGFTFTFIGTKRDTDYVVRDLNIDESNTLVYDGSGKGLEKALVETASARTSYTTKLKAGEDVTRGFYKSIK